MVGQRAAQARDPRVTVTDEVELDVDGLTVVRRRRPPSLDTCRSPCIAARSSASPASRATARPSSSRRSSGSGTAPAGASRSAASTSPTPSTRFRRERGIGYIPEDRQHDGLLLTAPLWENGMLGHQTQRHTSPRAWIDRAGPAERTEEIVDEFDVRTPGSTSPRRAVGRQPAEAHRRARDARGAEGAHRRPPDPGHRRRRPGRGVGQHP